MEAALQQEIYAQTIATFLTPIAKHLEDPSVTEVMVNGPSEIFIERAGKVTRVPERFPDNLALMGAVKNIAQYVGKRITDEEPRMDARLPDGSRVHVIIPPCSRKGVCVAIRKFFKERLTMERLVAFGSVTKEAVEFLGACVKAHKNTVISGGTGSGKTSLLNVLSGMIPPDERIIVIEDSTELQLQQEHVLPLEARQADKYGRGRVTIRDLFHSAMRLRPDRVVIGEVRGGEALDLIQAMTSGHSGSMSTTHANSPKDAFNRLETLALMSGVEMPLFALRAQVASAVEIVVQTSRMGDGSRKVTHITEGLGLDPEGNYRFQHLFIYRILGKDPATSKILGRLEATGTLPTFFEELTLKGIPCRKEIFEKPAEG